MVAGWASEYSRIVPSIVRTRLVYHLKTSVGVGQFTRAVMRVDDTNANSAALRVRRWATLLAEKHSGGDGVAGVTPAVSDRTP